MASRRITALAFLATAFVLLLVALAVPWWAYHLQVETTVLGSSNVDQDYYLSEVRTRGSILGNPFSDTTTVEEMNAPELKAVFDSTSLLLAVSIGLVALTLFAGFLAGLSRLPHRVFLGLGALATLVVLSTTLYFALALPSAIEASFPALPGGLDALTPQGFWGSDMTTVPGTSLGASWGPGVGWILALGALGAALIGVALPRGKGAP